MHSLFKFSLMRLMIKGQWAPAEQRRVLAKAEVTRPFAPGTEKHTGSYHLNNKEGLAKVKHQKNSQVP